MMLTTVIRAEQKCVITVFAYIKLDCLGHTGYSTQTDFITSCTAEMTFQVFGCTLKYQDRFPCYI